jgi:hypothetical protein
VPREMGEETRKTTSRGCSRMIDDGGGESGTRSAANQDVPITDYNLGGLSCRPRDHRQASLFVLGLRAWVGTLLHLRLAAPPPFLSSRHQTS